MRRTLSVLMMVALLLTMAPAALARPTTHVAHLTGGAEVPSVTPGQLVRRCSG